METRTRTYQETAIARVEALWASGVKSVIIVAPPGAGKTEMGVRLVANRRTVWVAHRTELIQQAVDRLRVSLGRANVGVIQSGHVPTPGARVQVASIETLVHRNLGLRGELLVLDEARHYVAKEWRAIREANRGALTLGLDATPERADGAPVGDIFEEMVVAASYSELIRDGIIVPARVLRPTRHLEGDLAQMPVDAYLRYAAGLRAFLFFPRVTLALAAAKELRRHHVRAECIETRTGKVLRMDTIARFSAGTVSALTNVGTMTEGVNIPAAACVVLGRDFDFVGSMIQAVGRALRASPGKTHGLVIDLAGSTHRLGLPDQDRTYSLTGRPISGTREVAPHDRAAFQQDILNLELELVVANEDATPLPARELPVPMTSEKLDELEQFRLRLGARRRPRSVVDEATREQERYLKGAARENGEPHGT